MLESAEKYSDDFKRLQNIDHEYKAYFQDEVEDDDVQGRIKKKKKKTRVLGRCFIGFLKIFFNVTKKISGSKYATSNFFSGELVTMHATISTMCFDIDVKKRKMALSMKAKYEKYWDNLENMNFLLHVAYLRYCLGVIYGVDTPKSVEVLDQVKNTLNELFTYFKMKVDNRNDRNTTDFPSSAASSSELDLDEGYDKYLEENEDDDGTEVDIYIRDKTTKKIKGDNTFDILNWWKLNSARFPILSQVARHVLGIPISTIASESTFSTVGRVIDKYRISLTPTTAEALICTQDWVRSSPADLQDMPVCGQLEDMVESLENLEIDLFPRGKASRDDNLMDENSD